MKEWPIRRPMQAEQCFYPSEVDREMLVSDPGETLQQFTQPDCSMRCPFTGEAGQVKKPNCCRNLEFFHVEDLQEHLIQLHGVIIVAV